MGSFVREDQAKLHAVCVPYPAQGHICPMLEVAKLLHAQGFHITFVLNEYNLRRLSRAQEPNSLDGLEHFKFEAISDGLPPPDADVTQDIPTLSHAVMNYMLEPFTKLLRKLNDPSSGSPPITFIVSDCVMPFSLDAAREMGGIPLIWLWTASVCGMLGYLQSRELINNGTLPFKDLSFLEDGTLDQVVDWVPSMQDIPLKYMPSFLRITDLDDILFNLLMRSSELAAKSGAPVLFNTYDALDEEVLRDVSQLVAGPMYTIGPLQLQVKALPEHAAAKSLRSNLWSEDSHCLQWLDSKKPKSVVYVSFGSITTMTNDNLVEFAWGLANSGHSFLWILRPGLVSGEKPVIPAEFLAETKERGLIINWCDQENVLKHPSVGAFLTHCGWNSTLDTVCGGVPVLCWPFFAEQQTNCWFSCEKWKIGMEINSDVKREEVEKQVREVLEKENGKEMARKAVEWKKLAEEAVFSPSGSSNLNFKKFINEVVLPQKISSG